MIIILNKTMNENVDENNKNGMVAVYLDVFSHNACQIIIRRRTTIILMVH